MDKLKFIFLLLIVICFISCDNIIKKEITEFSKTPELLYGSEEGEEYFNWPYCIKYNKYDDKIYVLDSSNHRIIVLNKDFKYLTKFGRFGQGPGEFNVPIGIEFTKSGDLLIIDSRVPLV